MIVSTEHACCVCHEVITDPICATCKIKQVELWLRDSGLPNNISERVLERVVDYSERQVSSSTTSCLLCGSDTLSTCSYCFFLKVVRILDSLDVPSEIINEFIEAFNYQLGQTDYLDE